MAKNKKMIKRTLHYYWQATKKHKFLTFFTFFTSPAVELIRNIIIPLILADMIGQLANNPSWEIIQDGIIPEAIWIIALRGLGEVLGELKLYCHWKMEVFAMYHLANMAFDTISAQSMQFHNDRFSGSLVSQVNKFVSAYERFFDVVVWSVIPLFLTTTISLIILFIYAPTFALGFSAFIIFYFIVAYIYFLKMRPLNENRASAENKQTGQLADSITNINSVKSYANEKLERARYDKYNHRSAKAYIRLLNANLRRNIFFDSVYFGTTVIIMIFLIFGQSNFGLNFTVLYIIVTYSNNILSRLWDVNNILKDFNRVFGDAYEMTEILDMKDDVVDLDNAKPLKVTKGAVKFDNITFKHADAKDAVFENFVLDVQPGERIGLVGVSGSGKTTLMKLLLRFADVQDGEITIDNQDIRRVTQQSLRKAIAYVPQETALFHRSIAENIAYGKPNATQEEIEKAAKLANAHEFIKELPDGYETLVGERGIKLSGGQRQRIAIARAILKDAPILVLDEATSALDSESESLIQDALNRLMKGRTSLVIAHRLSTIASLDRIVVLDDGKIVEQGTHKELLSHDGSYQKLWSRQSGAFLEEK
ncbi:ABC transporter ATP-binding protein [Candidatus Saccharibacteria bacterium]|nr:ABC transporter ATP-binding protein [Candidatus Saccharibacteria bacterium]